MQSKLLVLLGLTLILFGCTSQPPQPTTTPTATLTVTPVPTDTPIPIATLTPIPSECNSDKYENCSDGTNITTDKCLEGRYLHLNATCARIPTTSPIPSPSIKPHITKTVTNNIFRGDERIMVSDGRFVKLEGTFAESNFSSWQLNDNPYIVFKYNCDGAPTDYRRIELANDRKAWFSNCKYYYGSVKSIPRMSTSGNIRFSIFKDGELQFANQTLGLGQSYTLENGAKITLFGMNYIEGYSEIPQILLSVFELNGRKRTYMLPDQFDNNYNNFINSDNFVIWIDSIDFGYAQPIKLDFSAVFDNPWGTAFAGDTIPTSSNTNFTFVNASETQLELLVTNPDRTKSTMFVTPNLPLNYGSYEFSFNDYNTDSKLINYSIIGADRGIVEVNKPFIGKFDPAFSITFDSRIVDSILPNNLTTRKGATFNITESNGDSFLVSTFVGDPNPPCIFGVVPRVLGLKTYTYYNGISVADVVVNFKQSC